MTMPTAAVTALPCMHDAEPAAGKPLLTLSEFGVAFGERVVLSSVSLTVPARGVLTLLGPGASGKSTLLRTLAGFNAANPSMRTWGEARYRGQTLADGEPPALVAQSARLLLASVFENVVYGLPNRSQLTSPEQRDVVYTLLNRSGLGRLAHRPELPVMRLPLATQRHLAILRCAASNPPLLCIDEPTTGLDDDDSQALLDYIRQESECRAILIVLHNQAQARQLGGRAALLAGGCIQETNIVPDFFETPSCKAAREFVHYGSCAVPAPDADPSVLDDNIEPPRPLPEPARRPAPAGSGPRGFLWLKRGRLAGTPRPGIVAELDHDLAALRRAGISVLISLTQRPVDAVPLAAHGLQHLWSPIPDMCAPSLEQATELCVKIGEFLAAGQAVAVHCRAGLGRTGTILACYLIWEGQEALAALEAARRIQPHWVQSTEQAEFLEEFARHVSRNRTADRRTAVQQGNSAHVVRQQTKQLNGETENG